MEEWISELKDRAAEFIQTEDQKEKGMKKTEDTFRDLKDTIKWTNICIIGASEGEERNRQKVYSKK